MSLQNDFDKLSAAEKVNARIVLNTISKVLREHLEPLAGTTPKLDDVKNSVGRYLDSLSTRQLVHGYEVGEVKQLWQSWTLKQKFKWSIYNKLPVIKEISAEHRNLIHEHNSMIDLIHALEIPDPSCLHSSESDETYDDLYKYKRKELPEHLICDPKTIVLTDVKIKPVKSLDFISINVEVSGDNGR
jgi:hypothetical protein